MSNVVEAIMHVCAGGRQQKPVEGAAVDAHCKVNGALQEQPLADLFQQNGQDGRNAAAADEGLMQVRILWIFIDPWMVQDGPRRHVRAPKVWQTEPLILKKKFLDGLRGMDNQM